MIAFQIVNVLIFFEAQMNIYSLSKQRFSCTLNGQIGPPPPIFQVMLILSLEWLAYSEHVIQFHINTCLFGVRSYIRT